jgi:hypothetical protein
MLAGRAGVLLATCSAFLSDGRKNTNKATAIASKTAPNPTIKGVLLAAFFGFLPRFRGRGRAAAGSSS